MIFRRLSQSLKEQNWTAIWIEFILLVAGVFLGIQVANWNAERVSNKQSEIFTNRLREDLRIEAWNYISLNGYYGNVLSNAERTLAALEGDAQMSNEALIIAAYRATQYGEFVRYRSTYDELTSIGSLGLIKDPMLRKTALQVYNSLAYENLKTEGINSRYRIAFRMKMPLKVQTAIGSKCGDQPQEVGNYSNIDTSLDYACTTGLAPEAIDNAARILRSDAVFVELLRLRIGDVKSQLGNAQLFLSEDVRNNILAMSKENP
jgi:hypothetical protein